VLDSNLEPKGITLHIRMGLRCLRQSNCSECVRGINQSDPGNGAVIITNPDAPILLAENYSLRTATSLGLMWSEGPSNGGSTVLDY